jgi:hypothetical protein
MTGASWRACHSDFGITLLNGFRGVARFALKQSCHVAHCRHCVLVRSRALCVRRVILEVDGATIAQRVTMRGDGAPGDALPMGGEVRTAFAS